MKGLLTRAGSYLRTEAIYFLLLLALFVVGAVMGFGGLLSVPLTEAESLREALGGLLEKGAWESGDYFAQFWRAFVFNGLLLFIIFFVGASMFGTPIICAALFYKGYSLGYLLAFLYLAGALRGFLLAFLLVLPQAAILIPVFLLASKSAIAFSLSLLTGGNCGASVLLSYSLRFVILFAAVLAAAFWQGYLSPLFLQIFLNF